MPRTQQRNEFEFGAFDEDYRGFDPHEEDGGRGPLILFLAIAVVLVFAAVVWNTYSQGVRAQGQSLPVIAAADGPYKRAPEDPGGAEAPDLNRRIYDQMDGSTRDDIVIASALRAAPTAEGAVEEILQGGPPLELRPGLGLESAEPAPEDERASIVETPMDPPTTPRQLAPQPVAPTPAPVEPRRRFAFESDGGFLVQIAALRSQDAAEDAWARAVGRSPMLYAGAERRIQRADLGSRGIFYRLRAGAFADRPAATAWCDALKAEGGDCIVVQR